MDLLEQLKQQHGIDALVGSYIYEYEHEFMNQVTTKLLPVGGGGPEDVNAMWQYASGARVYALLERQKSRKFFKFYGEDQCPTRQITCLAACNNGADVFGEVSVSMSFNDVKTAIPNTSPVASSVSPQVGGR